ncbi:MAG: DUF2946 family protein [Sulfuritalea sp.]|nr:DUF2946 family protein [Sulfuritalea sp.]
MPIPDPVPAIKWPNVPACYGWLALNRRGVWLLKDQPITHKGLIDFISSHYGPDPSGNYVFQNGPQAVYVALDYTPYVFRRGIDGQLTAHTGVAAGEVAAVYLDDNGSVLLKTDLGIGLLDDRDLPAFLEACVTGHNTPVSEHALLAAMAGDSNVSWNGHLVQSIRRQDVALKFSFQPNPVA